MLEILSMILPKIWFKILTLENKTKQPSDFLESYILQNRSKIVFEEIVLF
jgi:hypothetical protein